MISAHPMLPYIAHKGTPIRAIAGVMVKTAMLRGIKAGFFKIKYSNTFSVQLYANLSFTPIKGKIFIAVTQINV